MFITIEGIDGAGKSTVASAIEWEFGAVVTGEPSEFKYGKYVREALVNDTPAFVDFFLFMADRHYHIENLIKPALEEGKIVVSDRFSDSTLAYQPIQLENKIKYPQQWMERVMRPWNIEPDMTIYLDISVDTALQRADRVEKYENEEMLRKVKSNYDALSEQFSDRYVRVDAERSKKDVIADVLDLVEQALND